MKITPESLIPQMELDAVLALVDARASDDEVRIAREVYTKAATERIRELKYADDFTHWCHLGEHEFLCPDEPPRDACQQTREWGCLACELIRGKKSVIAA